MKFLLIPGQSHGGGLGPVHGGGGGVAVDPGLDPARDGELGQGVDLAQLHRGLGLDQRLSGRQDLPVRLDLGPHDQLVLEGAGQRGVDVIHPTLFARL